MHCYEYPPVGGGGGKIAYGLSKELVALGHEVDFVTMKYRKRDLSASATGIHLHSVPCIRTNQFICYAPELATYIAAAIPYSIRLVRQHKYDLNHTHFAFPDGVVAWICKQQTGLPYILTVHGSDIPGHNPDRFVRLHRVLSPLWKKVIASASHIIAASEVVKALIQVHVPGVPITVIPHGIDVARFPPNQSKKARILAVSRLHRMKGFQYLLKAVAAVENRHGYEIHIVGDGPYRQTLQQMAKDFKLDVKFWGHLDNDSSELKNLYGSSRIFVFPSERENFGVVLLEAMAAELAIITTKSTGCSEVVGEAGILVEAGDIRGISKALAELMGNPDLCGRLGQAARKRVENRFTWAIVANRYIDLYKKYACSS